VSGTDYDELRRISKLENAPSPIATPFPHPLSTRSWQDDAEVAAFLAACELFLKHQCPGVVWTFGVDPVSLEMQRLAKREDIPIVMGVDEAEYKAEYKDDSPFKRVDYAIVSSEEARQYHWRRIGLASVVLLDVSGTRDNVSGTLRVLLSPGGTRSARSVPDTSAYREFFATVTHQPGPPLVPLDVVTGSIVTAK
jgi:hypothetical protein